MMAGDCEFGRSLVSSEAASVVTPFSSEIEVGRDRMLHGALNGGTRRVALSSRAIEILKALKPKDETSPWFGITARTLSAAVVRAREKLGLKDFCLHDLRHEATSKLFEKGLSPIEVATMTGHKTPNTLKRYTHPNVTEIARKLG